MNPYMRTLVELSPRASDSFAVRAQLVGSVTLLELKASRNRRMRSSRFVDGVILQAAQHGQVEVFYGRYGDAVGYVVWATLCEETEARLLRTGVLDFHVSEWNENGTLWVLAICAHGGHFRLICKELIKRIDPSRTEIRYGYRRGDLAVFREASLAAIARRFQ